MGANYSWFLHSMNQGGSEVPSGLSSQQHQTLDSVLTVCMLVLFSHLHVGLCRPQDLQSVQHGPDVWVHDFTLICALSHILFQELTENISTFATNELKRIKNVLSPDYKESLESQSEGEAEKQRSSREAFLKIIVNTLRNMDQEGLADLLQSSKTFTNI